MAPVVIDTGFGVMVMVASAPVVTETEANPETPPLDAWTVLAKVPADAPAVKTPDALIVPPPATTDHVGVPEIVTALPRASCPVTMNCCVVPAATAFGFGVTTMIANGPGSESESAGSVQAAKTSAIAGTTSTRRNTSRRRPERGNGLSVHLE